jgi:MFS family permease
MKIPFRFYLIIGSQFFSKIGDYAHDIVFVILSIELSKSNYLLVGIIYFVKFIPYLFLGPLGGVIADKYNRKNIMILSDLSRFI